MSSSGGSSTYWDHHSGYGQQQQQQQQQPPQPPYNNSWNPAPPPGADHAGVIQQGAASSYAPSYPPPVAYASHYPPPPPPPPPPNHDAYSYYQNNSYSAAAPAPSPYAPAPPPPPSYYGNAATAPNPYYGQPYSSHPSYPAPYSSFHPQQQQQQQQQQHMYHQQQNVAAPAMTNDSSEGAVSSSSYSSGPPGPSASSSHQAYEQHPPPARFPSAASASSSSSPTPEANAGRRATTHHHPAAAAPTTTSGRGIERTRPSWMTNPPPPPLQQSQSSSQQQQQPQPQPPQQPNSGTTTTAARPAQTPMASTGGRGVGRNLPAWMTKPPPPVPPASPPPQQGPPSDSASVARPELQQNNQAGPPGNRTEGEDRTQPSRLGASSTANDSNSDGGKDDNNSSIVDEAGVSPAVQGGATASDPPTTATDDDTYDSDDSDSQDRYRNFDDSDFDWDETDVANELEMLSDMIEGLLDSMPPPSSDRKKESSASVDQDKRDSEKALRKRLYKVTEKLHNTLVVSEDIHRGNPVPELKEQEDLSKAVFKRANDYFWKRRWTYGTRTPWWTRLARKMPPTAELDAATSESESLDGSSADRQEPVLPPETSKDVASSSSNGRPTDVRASETGDSVGQAVAVVSTHATVQPLVAGVEAGGTAWLSTERATGAAAESLNESTDNHDPSVSTAETSTSVVRAPTTNVASVKPKVTKAALERAKATKAKLAVKMKLLNALRKQKILENARPATGAPSTDEGRIAFSGRRLPHLSALRTPLSTVNVDGQCESARVHLAEAFVGDQGPMESVECEGKPAVEDRDHLEKLLSSPLPATTNAWATSDPDPPPAAAAKLSREDLLRRHKEVERKKAITLCRNVIAKHEALEAEQSAKLKETKAALEVAQTELQENAKEIEATEQLIATLRLRKQAVESLASEYVTKLVDARRALHEHRTQFGEEAVGSSI